MKNSKTSLWLLPVTLACTWFATHVGGGFATGSQLWQFYGTYGVLGLLTVVGWGAISAWMNYNAMEFARLKGITNYTKFLEELYKPLPRIGATIMEILYHPMMIVAISIVLATGGSLAQQMFNAPRIVGIVGMIILVSFIVMFGANLVRASATFMSFFIVIPIVVIAIAALSRNPISFGEMARAYPPNNIPMALVMMIMYVGVQVTNTVALVSVSEPIQSQRVSRRASLFGFILNVAVMLLATFTLIANTPVAQSAELPMLSISQSLGNGFYVLYLVMLIMAAVTTGVGIMTGIVNIVGARITIVKSSKKLNALAICLIYIILAGVLALGFGLSDIIGKFLPVIGGISVLAVIFPICIVAPIKNAKLRKQQDNAEVKE